MIRILIISTIIGGLSFMFSHCTNNSDKTTAKSDAVMQADIEFSKLSEKEGRNKAFLSFCHEEAVMLLPNNMPIKGKVKISELLLKKHDTSYTLIWKPKYGFISESQDLGYTYGIWTYSHKDESGNQIDEQGTYCTIWKKDKNGDWKWILDTGNEGLSSK